MSSQPIVLVIDADAQRSQYLKNILEFIDHSPLVVDLLEPVNLESLPPVEMVVCGLFDPEKRRPEIIRTVKSWNDNIPILQIVDKDNLVPSEHDLSSDIFGYLELPTTYQQFTRLFHQAAVYREARRQPGHRQLELFRLVGNSPAMSHVRKLISQVADSEANVLILGESGTGKEVVARHLHYHSKRRNRPFVPINCGAIPGELLESELFGHEKGAFTGAISARQGRFEMAEGGTLFLDEVGDMSLPMQVKLLRVLQERTFERVGSNKSISTDVRIIAATHRKLEDEIKQGRFRADLFYRLNVFPIEISPLRERPEDIPLLINELLIRIAHQQRRSTRLTQAALACLTQYSWPGNVRELTNLIERLVILYPNGIVDVGSLPEKFQSGSPIRYASETQDPLLLTGGHIPLDISSLPRLPAEGINLKEHLSNLEYSLIKQALQESHGVVAQAAKRLQLGRTTLVEKLRKYEGGVRDIDDRILT